VVFFPSRGLWIAHGINLYITAHGKTLSEAQYEFGWAVVGIIIANIRRERAPFEGIGPAPDIIKTLFDEADTNLPDKEIPLPSGTELPPAFLASRIIESGKLLSTLN
jgi:hypothetical protein